jgi:CRISPR-associated protein Csm2
MPAMNLSQIKQAISSTQVMRDLKPIEFADPDGLADSLVQYFLSEKKDLKATQLRKIFQSIKTIQRRIEPEINKNATYKDKAFDRNDVANVMVNLAYARGRRLIPDDFYTILTECLSRQKLQTNEDFIRVAEFTEAILAYYKFRGGAS